MKRTQINNKFLRSIKFIYHKIFRINDSPQRIALGFGLGVFLGILPGTGPLASLVLATFLCVNRASALLGSVLTNTWLSFVTFLLSIRIGSFFLGLEWQRVKTGWEGLITNFSWRSLLKISNLEIILPVALGYLVIGLVSGALAYLMVIIVLAFRKKKRAR